MQPDKLPFATIPVRICYNWCMKDIWDGIINIILSGLLVIYEGIAKLFKSKKSDHDHH